jgi:NADP-dependent alcohol dehydrogenase
MLNFSFHNPVKIVFGKGTIAELSNLIPSGVKTMMLYGGGSIKKNGVYDQTIKALKEHDYIEFGGIEANPHYETCMRAVAKAKEEGVGFLLSVGGGSVLDATKFIAAAMEYKGEDPWDIMGVQDPIDSATPLGAVLTLPATGSEMNGGSVISRESTGDKLFFISQHVYPQFSILDPETTFSLSERQVANGIVDTFVHVLEQYMTHDINTPLQDRQAEAVLKTVVEEAPKVIADPRDYDVRANLMWCATNGLNNLMSCGVVQDWATHMIGHELTALYGVDHGQSLAMVMPAMMSHQRDHKRGKLLQYAQRVWDITEGDEDSRIDLAISKTKEFFSSIGAPTSLSECSIPEQACSIVPERLASRNMVLGEHGDIGKQAVEEILKMAM